ncbi:MAG: hypothetical protein WAU47_06020 [Desulfobaccales bacterium]
MSQDLRAKEMFDITTDRVSLISIHSAKGLDFDLVYPGGGRRPSAHGGDAPQTDQAPVCGPDPGQAPAVDSLCP